MLNTVSKAIECFGGRKFIVAYSALIFSTLLQAFDKLDSSGLQYTYILGLILSMFVTANVAQKKILKSNPPEGEAQ
jgi:hypothetical protein